MSHDEREDIQKRERTTIDDARKQGIGEPEDGIDLNVPTYTDSGGVSDLGVDEPIVPPSRRGKPAEENNGNE